MSDLIMSAGHSADRDTETSVREAVSMAQRGLGGQTAQLAIIAATVDHDATRVHAAFRAALPDTRLHGATTSLGVLTQSGVVMGPGGGVGVLLFASAKDASFTVGSADFAEGPREAGRRAAKDIIARGPRGLLPRVLLIAATPGNEEDILAGIADALPGVPVFGGSAADHAIEGVWSIFTDQSAISQGVTLAAIHGDIALGTAFDGPYEPTPRRATITQAEGRTLHTLDGRPATAVLHEWIGDRIAAEVRHGGNLLVQTALSPVAVPREQDQNSPFYLLLHPAQAHPEGHIDLFARAPVGATLCLMAGSEASLVHIIDKLADKALASAKLEPGAVRGAFLIYCAGCAGAVGAGIEDVLARLRARLGDIPLLGFCTFGEQGHVPGIGNIHSNLSVALVLAG